MHTCSAGNVWLPEPASPGPPPATGELTTSADEPLRGAKLAEVEARWDEGMILASERLQARALLDEARMRQANMQYQHQLSMAVLRLAMGNAYTGS